MTSTSVSVSHEVVIRQAQSFVKDIPRLEDQGLLTDIDKILSNIYSDAQQAIQDIEQSYNTKAKISDQDYWTIYLLSFLIAVRLYIIYSEEFNHMFSEQSSLITAAVLNTLHDNVYESSELETILVVITHGFFTLNYIIDEIDGNIVLSSENIDDSDDSDNTVPLELIIAWFIHAIIDKLHQSISNQS